MKNGQAARRSRGRSNSRSNNASQRYGDQNRNEQRVRGNPPQLVEKYKSLAKDALSSGDRVLAENYFQHADHYLRLINERQGVKTAEAGDVKDTSAPENSARRPKKQRKQGGDEQPTAAANEADVNVEQTVADSSVEKDVSEEKPVEKKVRRPRRPNAKHNKSRSALGSQFEVTC